MSLFLFNTPEIAKEIKEALDLKCLLLDLKCLLSLAIKQEVPEPELIRLIENLDIEAIDRLVVYVTDLENQLDMAMTGEKDARKLARALDTRAKRLSNEVDSLKRENLQLKQTGTIDWFGEPLTEKLKSLRRRSKVRGKSGIMRVIIPHIEGITPIKGIISPREVETLRGSSIHHNIPGSNSRILTMGIKESDEILFIRTNEWYQYHSSYCWSPETMTLQTLSKEEFKNKFDGAF